MQYDVEVEWYSKTNQNL